ncbi:MAG: hypothetical protein ACREYA_36965 [Cupriavidus necator]
MPHHTRDTPATRDKGDALGLTTLYLARHRSLDRLNLSAPALAGILMVPVAFHAAEWMLRARLSAGWAAALSFWTGKLGIDGTVVERTTPLAWFDFTLPYLSVHAAVPVALTWFVTLKTRRSP